MSIDRPIQREQDQEHRHDSNNTSDRERRYSGDVARLNEHELVAVDEWLSGTEPAPYEIDLTDGYEYRTRYWRCRNCGHERNRRDEFSATVRHQTHRLRSRQATTRSTSREPAGH